MRLLILLALGCAQEPEEPLCVYSVECTDGVILETCGADGVTWYQAGDMVWECASLFCDDRVDEAVAWCLDLEA